MYVASCRRHICRPLPSLTAVLVVPGCADTLHRDEGSCKSRALQFLLEVRNELTRCGKQELFVQFQETLTAFNEGRCGCCSLPQALGQPCLE